MKIEQILQNMEPKIAKKVQYNLEKLPRDDSALNENKTLTKTRLISLLDTLSPEKQRLILNTLSRLNLPLQENTLIKLINLLENSTLDLNQRTIVNSFSFLSKEGLPILPGLIQGVGQNIDQEYSMVFNLLNRIELPENIKEQLSLVLSPNSKEIAKKLTKYPDILKTVINQYHQKNDQNPELLNQLIGELLINNQNEGPLLALEIPIFWPENEQTVPFFLHIWKQEEKNSDTSSNRKEYNLKMDIKLVKRGIIKANIKVVGTQIKTLFQTDTSQTANLIRQNINILENQLEKLNYNLISRAVEINEDISDHSLQVFTEFDKDNNIKDNYINIDFWA